VKTRIIFFGLLFSFGVHAKSFRVMACEVKLQNKLQDKTTFYLRPGQKVTARMSILNGTDEIFLTVDHNMRGKSCYEGSKVKTGQNDF
jgi:hypothetical protein